MNSKSNSRCAKTLRGILRIIAPAYSLAKPVEMAALVIFLLISLVPAPGFSRITDRVPDVGQNMPAAHTPVFHVSLSRGIELIFNGRYEEGLTIFDRLQRMYPEHPAPYFFKAAAYQDWMSNYRTKRFTKELKQNIRLAIETGNALLDTGDDPWIPFYIGAAYGYRAFNRFRENDWIGSYVAGRKGIDKLKEALEMEPNIYDAYLGLGSYHYWRTAKSKFLRIIAFWMKDKRELGLRQLQFSAKHGLYAKNQASYNLVAAYYDYGRYEKASEVLEGIIERKERPSISDLYYRGRLLMKFERWSEAEFTFKELLERLEGQRLPSVGYQVECKYWIAEALKLQGRLPAAFSWAKKAMAQREERSPGLELQGPFESFDDIKRNLERLYRDLEKTLNYPFVAEVSPSP
ncbi:MAG: hypothetical protein JRJ29_11020 [Deltaproteobacteria bacterium]|nr:hypothetical protein [Deltaproteobacteria bacterium]